MKNFFPYTTPCYLIFAICYLIPMTFLPENIFLKIIAGDIPSEKIYESETVLAFKDIRPKAAHHILIIPKKEITTLMDAQDEDAQLLGQLLLAANQVAQKLGLEGYKIHVNVGEKGGQVVPHLHLHILSPDYQSTIG